MAPGLIVHDAAGNCPIKFTMFWDIPSLPADQTICSWFWEVRHYGLRRGEFYTAEAIANWAATIFGETSPESDYVRTVVLNYAEAIQDYSLGPEK